LTDVQTATPVAAPPAAPAAPVLGYRPELDGMRAIAVGLVIAYHSYLGFADGGWLGVDVFFVLSGFLITALLLRERDGRGSVRLNAFYARRMLRLLPALAVLLVVVGAASAQARAGIPWVVGYVSNWGRIAGGRYGPLDHLWSLSVEEQFYLVWPLVLLGLIRLGRPRLTAGVTFGLAATVTLARCALVATHSIGAGHAYLGSDMRADALLYGCVIGIAFQAGWLHQAARLWRLLVVPATLGLVAVAFGPYGPAAPRAPYAYAAVDLAAVVVVAFVVTRPDAVGWLRWPPLVRLGVVSYGIYLWHYPVMWGLDNGLGADPMVVLVGGTVAGVALALVSWRIVEAPALRLKRRFGVAS
jgi:peptidoglycan/LPS O-acetylase OafA/YrhL